MDLFLDATSQHFGGEVCQDVASADFLLVCNAQVGQAAQVRPPIPASQQAVLTPSNAPRAYTIRSGDTLSAISKRFYGTPTRWIDIYQANRDRISSESAIRVGQEIRIP